MQLLPARPEVWSCIQKLHTATSEVPAKRDCLINSIKVEMTMKSVTIINDD